MVACRVEPLLHRRDRARRLAGRPALQKQLAERLDVISADGPPRRSRGATFLSNHFLASVLFRTRLAAGACRSRANESRGPAEFGIGTSSRGTAIAITPRVRWGLVRPTIRCVCSLGRGGSCSSSRRRTRRQPRIERRLREPERAARQPNRGQLTASNPPQHGLGAHAKHVGDGASGEQRAAHAYDLSPIRRSIARRSATVARAAGDKRDVRRGRRG